MKRKTSIVVDMHIPFLKGVLDDVAHVRYMPWQEMTHENLQGADALIIRTRTCCDRSLLEGLSVRMIATASIGFDHIDTDFCKSRGIRWTNAPGCNSSSVRQYMFSALMVLARRKKLKPSGTTIGIIGVGYVGSKVEKLSKALGMRVLLNDPPRERTEGPGIFSDLKLIRKEADIITLHVPLNHQGRDRTLHMVDRNFFDQLGGKAILINTSRGSVVDGKALIDAIRSEQLSATVLDVWEDEPRLDRELLELVDIGTPHIAGYSADGKANAASQSVQAVSRFFHLGMDSWYPETIPPPENERIHIDGTGKGQTGILCEAARKSYDILKDDHALRSAPESFEQLRAAYPLRREPAAFRVSIENDDAEAGVLLEELGFRVMDQRNE